MLKVVFEMRKVSTDDKPWDQPRERQFKLWIVRHQDVMEVIRDSR